MYSKLIISIFLLICWSSVNGQPRWNNEQEAIIDAINELSSSTALEGRGADAYALLLDDAFARWTLGSDKIVGKSEWVEGIRGWFTDGWHVSDRQSKIIEIKVMKNQAFVRRIVTETFTSPEGKLGQPSKAALSEVWIKKKKKWLLSRVDLQVL